jgi:hypothetical protein
VEKNKQQKLCNWVMVAHTFNPSTGEAEALGSLESEFKNKQTKTKKPLQCYDKSV